MDKIHPCQRVIISNETLELLKGASDKLDPPKKGVKRARYEPGNDDRATYPTGSKPLYLKTKNLHRRKLALAANIHQIKTAVSDNRYPQQVNFRCSFPPNRDASFKNKWQQIIRKCKEDLTCLVMDDLNNKYKLTKVEIQGNLDTLKTMLSNQQFTEIKNFLDDKYKSAMPAAMTRASGRFSRKNNPRNRQPRPNWRSKAQAPRGRREKEPLKKGQLKDAIAALLEQFQ